MGKREVLTGCKGKALEEMTTFSEEPPFVLQCLGKGSFQILAVAKGHV